MYIYIYQLCMPYMKMSNYNFLKKTFFLFKISYILVCSKTFLRLCIKQKV